MTANASLPEDRIPVIVGVGEISDHPADITARLGIEPTHAAYGPVGGESPIRYLHEAAKRIARGECNVAAICGAEAQSTATKAERAGVQLPWTPFAHDVEEPK